MKMFINKERTHRTIKNSNNEVVYSGDARTVEDYIDECLHGNNECAYLVEKVRIDKSGKDAIVWADYETGETFISY